MFNNKLKEIIQKSLASFCIIATIFSNTPCMVYAMDSDDVICTESASESASQSASSESEAVTEEVVNPSDVVTNPSDVPSISETNESGNDSESVTGEGEDDGYIEECVEHLNLTHYHEDPTCTSWGVDYDICNDCHREVNHVDLEPVDHDYVGVSEFCVDDCSYTNYEICVNCNQIKPGSYDVTYAHDYSRIETVKPTCTSEGYDLYRCSQCGDEYQDNFTEMIDHDFEWIVDFDKKDCSIHGYYKCKDCDYIDPSDHTYTYEHCFDTGYKVLEPTCTEGGYTYLECSNCGYQSKSDFTAPLGHDYEFICENIYCNGNAEGYFKCNRCSDIILGVTKTGYEPTDHHYITVDDVEVVDATCTTEGYHKGKCQYCGEEVIDEGSIAQALGHEFINVYDSSCEYHKECSRCHEYPSDYKVTFMDHDYQVDESNVDCCGNLIEPFMTCTKCGDTIPCDKLSGYTHNEDNHQYVLDELVESTCKEAGYEKYVCSSCGDEYTKVLPIADHKYEFSSLVRPAKCEVEGIEYHKCIWCESTNRVVVPATGHLHITKIVEEPTCLMFGFTADKCEDCGKTFNDVTLPQLDHEFEHRVEPSTCHTHGKEYDYCTLCHMNYNEAELPLLEHDKVAVIDETATCTKEGHGHFECENCEYTEEFVLEKVPHTYGSAVKEIIKQPTYDNEGKYEMAQYCKECKHRHVTSTGTIAKLERPVEEQPSPAPSEPVKVNPAPSVPETQPAAPSQPAVAPVNNTNQITSGSNVTGTVSQLDTSNETQLDNSANTVDLNDDLNNATGNGDVESKEEVTKTDSNIESETPNDTDEKLEEANNEEQVTNDELGLKEDAPVKKNKTLKQFASDNKVPILVVGGISLTAIFAVLVKKLISTFIMK